MWNRRTRLSRILFILSTLLPCITPLYLPWIALDHDHPSLGCVRVVEEGDLRNVAVVLPSQPEYPGREKGAKGRAPDWNSWKPRSNANLPPPTSPLSGSVLHQGKEKRISRYRCQLRLTRLQYRSNGWIIRNFISLLRTFDEWMGS